MRFAMLSTYRWTYIHVIAQRTATTTNIVTGIDMTKVSGGRKRCCFVYNTKGEIAHKTNNARGQGETRIRRGFNRIRVVGVAQFQPKFATTNHRLVFPNTRKTVCRSFLGFVSTYSRGFPPSHRSLHALLGFGPPERKYSLVCEI